jgi:hypothetical protein
MVGQAGAGSSRALRGKGTPPTASYEWATRTTGISLPRQAVTTATGAIVEDGRLRSGQGKNQHNISDSKT